MNPLNPFFTDNWTLLVVIVAWVIFWKGCSLWIAVKNDQKKWFVALLVLNTLGILELVYIFFIAKKKWVDIKEILIGKI